MKRTLSLRRESLADLSVDELSAVAGGDAPYTWFVQECLRDLVDTMQPTRCLCP